jgi:uncharacterized protein YgiM (DUF1202 family)
MQISDKTIARLWKITLLLVLLLLLATIGLAVQARGQPAAGVDGQINKRFFMREGPAGVARISAVLRQGTVVTITDSVQRGSTIWYQIEIGELMGWVPSDAVTIRE